MSVDYDTFKNALPENIREDRETFLKLCRDAKIEVPLVERFYLKKHTPQPSKYNKNPRETEYVVVPSPKGGRDLWVHKEDYASFVSAVSEYGKKIGLV